MNVEEMLFVAFLFLITLSVAKSDKDFETKCKNDYRDLNNTPIDVMKYCSNKLCIEKCCAAGDILRLTTETCGNAEGIFKKIPHLVELKSKINYSTNILSSRDENKESIYNFALVHNNRDTFKCTKLPSADFCEYYILKDGSIKWQDNESKRWYHIEKLDYCIDYKIVVSNGKPDMKIIIRGAVIDDKDRKLIEAFEIPAILISSFFLLLVLVVYSLLPDLRNLSGLILMAYTFSLLFAFINKLVLTFIKKKNTPDGFCKKYSPVVYFGFMASIFWLSVLSFEVWSGIRAFRIKHRSKRADLMKFMWYNLYAWGTPLLITAIVTTLDNIVGLNIVEAPFKDCLMDGAKYDYYFKIPIGVLIFIDIVLFSMTAYHIWIVRRAINQHQDSKNSNAQNKTAATYAKLSVMMGLSWCLELLPATDYIAVYILINLYNLLTGVAIFYWFVCDKKVLMPLCKKFNIRNKFTKKWEAELSQPTKSGTTRSTGASSCIVKNRPKDGTEETDIMKNCPEESIIV